MKKLILVLAAFVSLQAGAQTKYTFKDAWFISGGAGTSVFLGDVAPVPKITFKKNTNEYKLAYMFRLGKKVIPALDFNIEFLKGDNSGTKLRDAADNKYDRTFTGDYWTLTFNARLDPLKLFAKTRDFPLSFFGRVGVGPVYYRALQTRESTGAVMASAGYVADGVTKDKRAQATVVPCGFGLCYDFCGKNLRLETAVDIYNAFTDNMDAKTGITKYNDKFFTISGSIVYGFDWDRWRAPKFRCDNDSDGVKAKYNNF